MINNHLFLPGIVESMRFYVDEATVDAKATDDTLIRLCIMPALVDVMGRLNLNMDHPVLIRHQIDLVAGQQYYQLPPAIGSVWRFAILDEDGRVSADSRPRGEFNPSGPGWAIEGSTLSVRPFPTDAQSAHIWYTPSGDFLPHLRVATTAITGNTSLDLGTPTYGLRDAREGAYNGAILRVVPTTGPIQERVIASHTITTGGTHSVTVRVPFDPTLTSVGTYEIVPAGASVALYEAIALAACIRLGAARRLDPRTMNHLEKLYRAAMKTIKDNFSNLQLRTGKGVDKVTVDRSERGLWFGPWSPEEN